MEKLESIIFGLKAEVERLQGERNKYKELYETMYRKWSELSDKEFNCEALRKEKNEYFDKAVELQKQVDDYKRKIEQGTLLELPCKVGDTVYIVYAFSGIIEWEVDEIVIMRKDILFRLTHKGTKDYNFALLSEKGETLFFTREEAEKRLKELQE